MITVITIITFVIGITMVVYYFCVKVNAMFTKLGLPTHHLEGKRYTLVNIDNVVYNNTVFVDNCTKMFSFIIKIISSIIIHRAFNHDNKTVFCTE